MSSSELEMLSIAVSSGHRRLKDGASICSGGSEP